MLLTFMTKPDMTMVGVALPSRAGAEVLVALLSGVMAGCIVLSGSPEVSVTQRGHVQVPSGWIAL